jgi:acyl dehydratase
VAIDTGWLDGRITEEAVEELRARIGVPTPSSPWNSEATYDNIWHFALGVGDDNPLWWDRSYATEHTRWGRQFASPTFLNSCQRNGPVDGRPPGSLAEFETLTGVMGVWSSDRWVWRRPTWVGERVQPTAELHEVRELETRFGGRSLAHVKKTTFRGDDGDVMAELYTTLLRFERASNRERAKYKDVQPARYTDEDVARFHEQYQGEPGRRRGADTRYWDDVQEGEPLLTILKGPITLTNLVGWCIGWGSPYCQTNRIAYQCLHDNPGARLTNPETGIEDTLAGGHWDGYLARMGGMPAEYDVGGMRISWLAHLLNDWAGDDAFIRELDVRLRRPNLLGDVNWLTGTVWKKDPRVSDEITCLGGEPYGSVTCNLTATNQRGETTASAVATVVLPRKQGAAAR